MVRELAECLVWGSANVKWSDTLQQWSGCDICYTWGNTDVKWSEANWLWNGCSEPTPTPEPPTPTTASVRYDGVDATTLIQPWLRQEEEPWNPYKAQERKKKLVELICKVKGQRFDEQKYSSNCKVTVGDIKLLIKEVTNTDFDIKIGNPNVHIVHRQE
jgi:hypothetical protein